MNLDTAIKRRCAAGNGPLPALITSGSVALADTKISAASGAEFVDLGGPELVTNGGFDTATTGWTAVDGGVLSVESGGESGNCLKVTNSEAHYGAATQSFPTLAGKTYRLEVWGKRSTTPAYVNVGSTFKGNNYYRGYTSNRVGVWYRTYVEFVATSSTAYLWVGCAASTPGVYCFIDSVTCKEKLLDDAHIGKFLTLTDSAGKKATCRVIEEGTGETYSEKISASDDRTFDSDTGWWTKQTGVSIAGGVCAFSSVASQYGIYKPGIGATAGKLFKSELTLASVTTGGIRLTYGELTYSGVRNTAGTFTEYKTAKGSDYFQMLASVDGTTLDIGSISLKEVLTPSETGATVDWLEVDPAFNYNDSAGYGYTVVEAFSPFDRKQIGMNYRGTPAGVVVGGSMTPTGAISKVIGLVHMGGSLTPTGAVAKSISKYLAGSLTPTGSLSTSAIFPVSVGGELDMVGDLTGGNPDWIEIHPWMNWKGEWAVATEYALYDVVLYQDGLSIHAFVSKSSHNTGNLPTDAAHWDRLIQEKWRL